jgi:hypothetical protein
MSAKTWHYFVAYAAGEQGGVTYTASGEMLSLVPADSYEVIQGWAEEIKRNDSRIATVVVLNFQLLRAT